MAKITKSQKIAQCAKLNTIIDRSKKHCVWEAKVLDQWFNGIKEKAEGLGLDTKLIAECAELQAQIHAKLEAMVKSYEAIAKEWDEAIDQNDDEVAEDVEE